MYIFEPKVVLKHTGFLLGSLSVLLVNSEFSLVVLSLHRGVTSMDFTVIQRLDHRSAPAEKAPCGTFLYGIPVSTPDTATVTVAKLA